jgi:2-polyprenyl-6-methoxyphenol hydroxylase-like FAD-dependent oxidoreductase
VYRDARLTGCEQDDGETWRIEAVHDNRRRQFRANFLVDATGRAASLARKTGARRIACDDLIGIVGFLDPSSEAKCPAPDTLVEAVENGWWYSAALPDMRLVLAYMTDADLCRRDRHHLTGDWMQGLETAGHTRSRIKSYALPSRLRIFAANSSRLNKTAGKNWLAVGDAAMAFDPLSSQGVYKAIESGLGGAQVIREQKEIGNLAVHEFEAGVERSFNQYLLARAAFYASERRGPNSPFWRRRHSPYPLVEIRGPRQVGVHAGKRM